MPLFQHRPRSPPSSWASLTPVSGYPILHALYTPICHTVSASSPQKRYIITVTGSAGATADDASDDGWGMGNSDTWESLGEKAKEQGVKCSNVCWGFHAMESGSIQSKLGDLSWTVSSDICREECS